MAVGINRNPPLWPGMPFFVGCSCCERLAHPSSHCAIYTPSHHSVFNRFMWGRIIKCAFYILKIGYHCSFVLEGVWIMFICWKRISFQFVYLPALYACWRGCSASGQWSVLELSYTAVLMQFSTTFFIVFNGKDVRRMVLYDFGWVTSYFPPSGLKINQTLRHLHGRYQSARLLLALLLLRSNLNVKTLFYLF